MFINLTNAQHGGLLIDVDPLRIICIENRNSYRVIHLLGSSSVTVKETAEEIKTAITAATTPAPSA